MDNEPEPPAVVEKPQKVSANVEDVSHYLNVTFSVLGLWLSQTTYHSTSEIIS
jgi:hypothetical protein